MNHPHQTEKSIFLEVIELNSPTERAEFLDRICAGDSNLRAEVDGLLQAHSKSGDLLDVPDQAAALSTESVTETVGTVIGPFKILEQIGEGGMGIVYVAEQKKPVRRKVALKIIKPGMDTKQVIARFEAERQALALMDHPNIAKVLDVGATEKGQPYFAMELVRGLPITEYCDKKQLDTRERLELFILVCRAVQHAHLKGIIHRDLKPTNILVTLIDAAPLPKVIDFGVAKAVNQQLTDHSVYTAQTQLIGTPMYMSPEQAEMSNQDVDTRSDVYSLGVLLYELLTGTTPFDKETLKDAGFDEMRRIIREEEPPRPSDRISTLHAEVLSTVSAQRNIDAHRFSHQVRGELDWIVMQAMEKDRNRRYESASAFAAEIERYLSDEPVEACPPSMVYRLSKYTRRNKGLLSTVTLVAVTLLVGTGVSIWQAVEARNARKLADERFVLANDLLESEKKAKDEADAQSKLAQDNATKAADMAGQLGQYLYAAHLKLAHQAWNSGNVREVLELLARYQPSGSAEDLRGFEWHYLWRLCHNDQLTLKGHRDDVYFVAFSPDGKTLATASRDNTVKLWAAETGRVRFTLKGHADEVNCAVFSPDGQTLATASDDRSVKLWDVKTGREQRTLRGHSDKVYGVAFSPDGNTLASAGEDKTVKLWDLATGVQRATLEGHTNSVEAIAFAPDGKTLASASRDDTVKLWDLKPQAAERAILRGHSNTVYSLAFSPDGRTLATASVDDTIKLWDVATAGELATLRGHTEWVQSVAFSPDGKTIASAGRDGSVRLWNAATGRMHRLIRGHFGRVWSVAFSPDGQTLASAGADQTVYLWDLTRRYHHNPLPGYVGLVGSIAFAPDGRTLATGDNDGNVWLWEMATGQKIAEFRGHTGWCRCVAFSPDGSLLASAGDDGRLHLWDRVSGHKRATLIQQTIPITQIAFSPDGQTLASVDEDGQVKLSDFAAPKQPLTFNTNRTDANCLAFSPDGEALTMGHDDGTITLWNIATGQLQRLLERQTDLAYAIQCVAFAPDGEVLASASEDQTVKLWNPRTGELLKNLHGHTKAVNTLAFSPTGRTLATGSDDLTVKLWNVATGQELATLKHTGELSCVAFSPDGHTLAAGAESNDGQGVMLWYGGPVPSWTYPPGPESAILRGAWEVAADEIRQTSNDRGTLLIFKPLPWDDWPADYALSLKAKKVGEHIGGHDCFEIYLGGQIVWAIGSQRGTRSFVIDGSSPRRPVPETFTDNKVIPGRWHEIKVEVVGHMTIRFYLDGKLQTTHSPEHDPHGHIGIGTWRTQAVFKDIELQTLDGRTVMRPDLEALAKILAQHKGTK